MSHEPPDNADHDLFEPAIEQLYVKELKELGGESCRNLLDELLADRWKALTRQSCRQRQSPVPDDHDALRAFDALKHQFFVRKVEVFHFTLPELWRFLTNLTVRSWLLIGAVVFPILVALISAAYWVGSHMGKL